MTRERSGTGLSRALQRIAREKGRWVEVTPGAKAPEAEGTSYYFTTPGGKPINHPNAYRWPKVYHPSTRHVEVGQGWLQRGVGATVVDLATQSPDGLGGLKAEVHGVHTIAAARVGKGLWRAVYRVPPTKVLVVGFIQRVPGDNTFVHATSMRELAVLVKARQRRAAVYHELAGAHPIQQRIVALWTDKRAREKVVTVEHARQAGLCAAGIAAWLGRFGLSPSDAGAGVMVGAALLGALPQVLEDTNTGALFLRACEVAAAA